MAGDAGLTDRCGVACNAGLRFQPRTTTRPREPIIIDLRTLAKAGAVTLVACIVVGSIGMKTILGWLSPPPVDKPRPIVFDNGSVRDLPASAPVVPTKPRLAQSPPGQLRKCLQPGGGIAYSNLACPPGSKEATVRSDGVSVVPSGLPARPAAPPTGGIRPLQPGETLQQRATERAIEGATGGAGGGAGGR
jgi:hypothetical protein